MNYKKVRNYLDMLLYLDFDMRMLEAVINLPEPDFKDIQAYSVEGAEY